MKVGPEPGENLPPRSQKTIPALRDGNTLRVYVEGIRGSRATVRAGALRFVARLQGAVVPGRSYRVQVIRTGAAVVLRTLPEGGPGTEAHAAAAVRPAHGLPNGDAGAVMRAFVRSGLPLQPERLAAAWRRVRSSDRLSLAGRARLAAVLEAKGLLDSESLWERALDAVSGRGDSREGTGHGGRDPDAERRESRGRGDAAEPEPDVSRDEARERPGAPGDGRADRGLPVGDARETVVAPADLRAALARADAADDPLQLINHRRDRSGNWVVVPLEFREHDDFRAALKVRFSGDQAGPGRSYREAVLDVYDGAERWTFAILPAGEAVRVVALSVPTDGSPPGGSATGAARSNAPELVFEPLARRLERYGVGFAASPMSRDSNDGFSTSDDAGILQTVDSRA